MDNVTLIRVVSGLLVVLVVIVVPVYVLLRRPKLSVVVGAGNPYVSANDSSRFVVPRGAVLPSRCVKCSNTPSEPWLTKTFSWHSRQLVCLLLLGLWPYFIAVAIVQKKMRLAVPLCDSCKARRRTRLRIGAALLFSCIPVPWALGCLINDAETGIASALLLGVAMFVAGLVFIALASPLKPTRIGRDSAEFKGACPDFLSALHASASSKTFAVGQQS
jgi:hypothetical protein